MPLFAMSLMSACSFPKLGDQMGKPPMILDTSAVTSQTETLTVLSAVGGFSLIAGIVMLAISRGQRGWFPCVGGILLVLLNYAVAQYSHLIFYPLVVFTGLISGAWTYRIVRQILIERRTPCPHSRSQLASSVPSSGSLSCAPPASLPGSSSRPPS